MFKTMQFFNVWRRLRGIATLDQVRARLSSGTPPDIVRATSADSAFILEAYNSALSVGSVATVPQLKEYIERCVAVSERKAKPLPHSHPFIQGQPETWPIDDIFLLKMGDVPIGVLWLRDHNDSHLADERFGELIFLWICPELRGLSCWPHVDAFSKRWASTTEKTHFTGRCLKPSRRMAELFERSGFKREVTTASGMSIHVWIPCLT